MANIESFKEKIGGGVRVNQFAVNIDSTGLATGVDISNDFKFLCHSTSLPGSSIGQSQVFHRGRMIPLAGERQFQPWTVVVYADQSMSIRDQFETWSNAINNYSDNTGLTTPINYKGSATVQLLDRNSSVPLYEYRMKGIFPIEISEIQLGWAQNDVVGEFQVTFAIESFDRNVGGQAALI
jgi:hypothetical protein